MDKKSYEAAIAASIESATELGSFIEAFEEKFVLEIADNSKAKQKLGMLVVMHLCKRVETDTISRVALNNAILEYALTFARDKSFGMYFESVFRYFRSLYSNKLCWPELESFALVINISKYAATIHLNYYFELTKRMTFVLYSTKCKQSSYVRVLLKNFLTILEQYAEHKPDLFLNTLDEMFDAKYLYVVKMFDLCIEESFVFMKLYIDTIEKFGVPSDDEQTFLKLSRIILIYFMHQTKHDSHHELAGLLIQALKGILQCESFRKCLALVDTLIKIFYEKDSNEAVSLFKMLILNMDSTLGNIATKMHVMDTCILLSQILMSGMEYLCEMLTTELFELAYEFLMKLSRFLPHINYNKKICTECTNLYRHERNSTTVAAITLFSKSMEKGFLTLDYGKKIADLIEYKINNLKKLKCVFQPNLMYNGAIQIYQMLKKMPASVCCSVYLSIVSSLLDIRSFNEMLASKLKAFFIVDLLRKVYAAGTEELLYVEALTFLLALQSGEPEAQLTFYFHRFIQSMQSLSNSTNRTIVDILNDRKVLLPSLIVPVDFDRAELLLYQLKIYEKYWPKSEAQKSVIIQLFKYSKCPIQKGFALFRVNDSALIGLNDEIDELVQVLTKTKHNANTLKVDAVLGLIYFRMYQQRQHAVLEKLKQDKITDDLINTKQLENLDLFSLDKELELVKLMRQGFSCFRSYVEHIRNGRVKLKPTILSDISKNLITMAVSFQLRKFDDDGGKCWALVYSVSQLLNNVLGIFQAAQFFLELTDSMPTEIIEVMPDASDLKSWVNQILMLLMEKVDEFSEMLPKDQQIVLNCLLSLVIFYAKNCDSDAAIDLIVLIEKKIEEIETKESDLANVRAKMKFVSFVLMTKFNLIESCCLPLVDARESLGYICKVQHTSCDSRNAISLMLFEFIQIIADYAVVRYNVASVKPYCMMLIKCALKMGLVVRSAQIMLLLSLLDLTTEKYVNSETKISYVNMFLMLDPLGPKAETKERYCKPKNIPDHHKVPEDILNTVTEKAPTFLFNADEQRVRHCNVRLENYLMDHGSSCGCLVCCNPIVKLLAFQAGTHAARVYFFHYNFKTSIDFFSRAIDFAAKLLPSVSFLNREVFVQTVIQSIFWSAQSTHRFELIAKALETVESAWHWLKEMPIVDMAIVQEIINHEQSFQYILAFDATSQADEVYSYMNWDAKQKIELVRFYEKAYEESENDPKKEAKPKKTVLQNKKIVRSAKVNSPLSSVLSMDCEDLEMEMPVRKPRYAKKEQSNSSSVVSLDSNIGPSASKTIRQPRNKIRQVVASSALSAVTAVGTADDIAKQLSSLEIRPVLKPKENTKPARPLQVRSSTSQILPLKKPVAVVEKLKKPAKSVATVVTKKSKEMSTISSSSPHQSPLRPLRSATTVIVDGPKADCFEDIQNKPPPRTSNRCAKNNKLNVDTDVIPVTPEEKSGGQTRRYAKKIK